MNRKEEKKGEVGRCCSIRGPDLSTRDRATANDKDEPYVGGVPLLPTGKQAIRPTFLEKRTGERAGHDRDISNCVLFIIRHD